MENELTKQLEASVVDVTDWPLESDDLLSEIDAQITRLKEKVQLLENSTSSRVFSLQLQLDRAMRLLGSVFASVSTVSAFYSGELWNHDYMELLQDLQWPKKVGVDP